MFIKSIIGQHIGDINLVSFAVNEPGESCAIIPGSIFTTEPNTMVMSVPPCNGLHRFARLTRDEVVQMARFFAEAASKMEE